MNLEGRGGWGIELRLKEKVKGIDIMGSCRFWSKLAFIVVYLAFKWVS